MFTTPRPESTHRIRAFARQFSGCRPSFVFCFVLCLALCLFVPSSLGCALHRDSSSPRALAFLFSLLSSCDQPTHDQTLHPPPECVVACRRGLREIHAYSDNTASASTSPQTSQRCPSSSIIRATTARRVNLSDFTLLVMATPLTGKLRFFPRFNS